MDDKIIGIIGGLGPWATVDMFCKILKQVDAKQDQDYPKIIIYCNSQIPSRVEAIKGTGLSPVSALQETAKALEKAGADFLVIGSCGTHYYYNEIQKAVKVPVLNTIECCKKFILENYSKVENIGLLAAEFTVNEGVFENSFGSIGNKLIAPSKEMQKEITKGINLVKIGDKENARKIFSRIANFIIEKHNVKAVIFGCTEIPAVLSKEDIPVKCIDPTELIAREALKSAGVFGH